MTRDAHTANPIRSEIDLDSNGKQTGYLRLPHSVHRSAYGWIPIPIASIRNGDGPVVLIMAGNHGDEHEGNLNRTFPGNPAGTPTELIADYIEHTLLARADYLIDLHSGGSSLLYHGANMLAIEPRDAAEDARLRALLAAFGLPNAFLHPENPVHAATAARRQGAISILTELGGGGTVQPKLLSEARQGLLHLLGFIGVLHGVLVPDSAPASTHFMRVSGSRHYVYAYDRWLYEPLVELGENVVAGQAAARIHFPETPLREPVTLYFASAGEVVCKRVPAMVQRGDCLYHLAEAAS